MVSIAVLPNESWIYPVTDADRLILPSNDTSIETLLREPHIAVMHGSPRLCVLACLRPTLHAPWRKEAAGWTRIFERTYLAPLSNDTERGRLVAAFFDWLGKRYGQEIDTARNQACYEFLFDYAQTLRNRPHCPALLDIGCGPGTILKSKLPEQVPVIRGYDIGDEVRQAAHAAGLHVMTANQFFRGRQDFPVALSAYVMHYACDMVETLKAVARHLVPGGVWAMNFHKGINYSLFMSHLPGSGLSLTEAPQDSPFGLIVTVIA